MQTAVSVRWAGSEPREIHCARSTMLANACRVASMYACPCATVVASIVATRIPYPSVGIPISDVSSHVASV